MNVRSSLALSLLLVAAAGGRAVAAPARTSNGATATVHLTVGGRNPDPACWGCHEKGIAPQLERAVVHLPFRGASDCGACHRPHGKDEKPQLLETQPDLCLRCHGDARFRGKFVHSIIEGSGCTACHLPHSSDNAHLLNELPDNLCEGCHRGLQDKHGGLRVESKKCTVCHDPHSSSREKLIKPVVHEVMGDCSTCHTPTRQDPYA